LKNRLTLAQRQSRMRASSLPKPRMTRVDALNQLAAQIERMPDGPEKAALLTKYLAAKGRRRITQVKHVSDRPAKAEPVELDEENDNMPTEAWLKQELADPRSCIRCGLHFFWTGDNHPRLCADCYKNWQAENEIFMAEQREKEKGYWGAVKP